MKRLRLLQKFSIPLVFNAALFLAIFSLKLLGLTTDLITIALTMAVALEIIYLAVFIQLSINKNTQNLLEIQKQITNMKEDEERAQSVLIYSRHQMKALQQELDILRKGSYLKNANAHSVKARA